MLDLSSVYYSLCVPLVSLGLGTPQVLYGRSLTNSNYPPVLSIRQNYFFPLVLQATLQYTWC
jgi:hypothetical protein